MFNTKKLLPNQERECPNMTKHRNEQMRTHKHNQDAMRRSAVKYPLCLDILNQAEHVKCPYVHFPPGCILTFIHSALGKITNLIPVHNLDNRLLSWWGAYIWYFLFTSRGEADRKHGRINKLQHATKGPQQELNRGRCSCCMCCNHSATSAPQTEFS